MTRRSNLDEPATAGEPTADAASAPHSPEPAECRRADGKTLSLRPRAGLDAPRPCQGIRGIRPAPEVIALMWHHNITRAAPPPQRRPNADAH